MQKQRCPCSASPLNPEERCASFEVSFPARTKLGVPSTPLFARFFPRGCRNTPRAQAGAGEHGHTHTTCAGRERAALTCCSAWGSAAAGCSGARYAPRRRLYGARGRPAAGLCVPAGGRLPPLHVAAPCGGAAPRRAAPAGLLW